MPNYRVAFNYCPVVVVIDARDEDHAMNLALDEIPMGLSDSLMDTKITPMRAGLETERETMDADYVSSPVD